MTPFVADQLARTWEWAAGHISPGEKSRRSLALALCGVLWIPGASLPLMSLGQRTLNVAPPPMLKLMPQGAVDFHLRHSLPQKAFHLDNLGGYLVWESRERIKTFVDSRMELWPRQLLVDYGRIIQGAPEADQLLRKWNAEVAFLHYSEVLNSGKGDSATPPAGLQAMMWKNPAWALVYWDDAGMLYVRREVLDGRPELREWKRINPDDRTFAALGSADGETMAAIGELKEMTALRPDAHRPWRLLGHLLLKRGNPVEAAQALITLSGMPQARPEDLQALAWCLDTLNRPGDALQAVQKGLVMAPDHTGLLDLGGILLAQSGQLREGAAWLEKAGKNGPPDAQRELNLAKMLKELGENERAERHAERARVLLGQNGKS